MPGIQHYLRFRLGHEWYGIHVESIIEVLHLMTLSELPGARPDVLGMMRLRERVIPVVDLRIRFGMNAAYTLNTPIIVVNTPSGALGLVADDFDDLERIDPAQIAPHDASASRYITGTARLADALLLLLDIDLLRTEIPV